MFAPAHADPLPAMPNRTNRPRIEAQSCNGVCMEVWGRIISP